MKPPIAIEYVGRDVVSREGTAKTDGRGIVGLMLARALRHRDHHVDILVPGPRTLHPPFNDHQTLRVVSERKFPAFARDGTPYGALVVNDWTVLDRVPDVPIIYCPHEIERLRHVRTGSADEAAVAGQDRMFDAADWVWVPSRDIGDFLVNVVGISPNKVVVEPYGIECDLYRPMNRGEARKRLRLDPQTKIVLFVGRLEYRKGLDTLRTAFQSLEDDPSMHLVVVGTEGSAPSKKDRGAARQFLDWALSTERASRIHLCGRQPWTLLPQYYAAADVCAFPCYMEPFGLPTAEALACGAAIVGSDIDGFRELVRHERDGLLVPPGDADAFASGLRRVLHEPRWGTEDAVDQRRAHALTFHWDMVAERLAAKTFAADVSGISLSSKSDAALAGV